MPYTPSLGSNGPYSLVLGIHFTTRVAPMMVRREHNNGAPKFRVDTDGETDNTPGSPPVFQPIFYCGFYNKYAISHDHDCRSPRGPFDGYPSDAASTD